MNRRLYAVGGELDDVARRLDRGAWFGSIQGTLCHLVWADRQWMSRIAGWEPPPPGIKGSPTLIHDWDELRAARIADDARIEDWAAAQTVETLAGNLSWFSGGTGRDMVQPRWIPLVHMFNHQTHHRGQVHALITQAGVRPASTDLAFILDLAALDLA
jgi:uncharacterized damage-inducible protein DinB